MVDFKKCPGCNSDLKNDLDERQEYLDSGRVSRLHAIGGITSKPATYHVFCVSDKCSNGFCARVFNEDLVTSNGKKYMWMSIMNEKYVGVYWGFTGNTQIFEQKLKIAPQLLDEDEHLFTFDCTESEFLELTEESIDARA